MARREQDGNGGVELPAEVEERLDPLYREHPDGFVAARDALVKDLRAGGDRETAARVKKLRRPSQAAWLINRVSADDPDRTQRFAEAADELAEAQRRVLEEGADSEELRASAAREREEVGGMVEAARRVAGSHSASTTGAVLDRVTETLQAVATDGELRGRVLRGRVERETTAATIGIVPGTIKPPRGRARDAGRGREVERARRELSRLRQRLATAEARRDQEAQRVDAAERDLHRAKRELTAARRQVRELEREIARTEKPTSD
ncbi:MAG TPA: hypothetical protein VK326_08710 [Solirubrobacterales bacterium]|nr:hypothetical protein [Solirubrobacterales bacterium]